MNIAAEKIVNIIQNISSRNPNLKLIAEKNQMINNCENALNDLCHSLFWNRIFIYYSFDFKQKKNFFYYI